MTCLLFYPDPETFHNMKAPSCPQTMLKQIAYLTIVLIKKKALHILYTKLTEISDQLT